MPVYGTLFPHEQGWTPACGALRPYMQACLLMCVQEPALAALRSDLDCALQELECVTQQLAEARQQVRAWCVVSMCVSDLCLPFLQMLLNA